MEGVEADQADARLAALHAWRRRLDQRHLAEGRARVTFRIPLLNLQRGSRTKCTAGGMKTTLRIYGPPLAPRIWRHREGPGVRLIPPAGVTAEAAPAHRQRRAAALGLNVPAFVGVVRQREGVASLA